MLTPVNPVSKHPATMSPRLQFTFPAALALGLMLTPAARAADAVKLTQGEKSVRVEINGQFYTEYHFKDVPRPYFYPVIGPGGVNMTRHAPMKQVDNEDRDHPHHRGLWYAHGEINGEDFWSEGPKSGKTVHEKFLEVGSGKVGVIRSAHKWVALSGKTICTDERTWRIHPDRTIDLELTYKASEGELVLGDTKEGSCSIRVAETMRLKPNKFNAGKSEPGQIVLSTGVTGAGTWGKRAAWCDYHGLSEGKHVGVAILDHPSNPKHPTWWHVRDYGLFSANPFGVHDFESTKEAKKPKGAGDIKIEAGKSLTWNYRYVVHEGDEKQGKVADKFSEFAKSPAK